jgi:pilus assembly protein CpaC
MSSARIVVQTIAPGAGGVAGYRASESTNKPAQAEPVAPLQIADVLVAQAVTPAQIELKPEQAETFARARHRGTLALRNIADVNKAKNPTVDQAPRPGTSINVVRYGVALSMTTPKGPKGRPNMKCRGNKPTMRNFLVRALSFSAVAALTLNPALTPAVANDATPVPVSTGGEAKVRFLSLGIGKSVIIDLPREVKDVLVADPKIANAVVRSAQRAYIIGAAVGQTNVVFFDSAGQQVAAYDIAVKRDLNGVRAALRQTLPGIQIEGIGEGVMLTGSVSSPIEAQQAADLAARLVGGTDKVVNSISVRGRDQVMLKVNVSEVRRDIIKQMGVDLSASMNYGTAVVNFNNSNPFTAYGRPLVSENGLGLAAITKGLPTVTATMRAMESAGVVRTLAEPNLTAISGESATFIAGGEFPIPAGYSCDPVTHVCTTQISYKKFGISLNFTPVVLTEGRISLRVMTEVSELSNENSITLNQAGNSLTVPSIKTRRAETTLEIPSGGSMAMAGLIAEQTKQAVNGLPGLDSLPILGALFRSQDFVNNQTELMVLVTPYVVRAVAQKELSRPDDGFAPASDSQSTLLAQINRIYGIAGRVEPTGNYQTNFGFIID